MKQEIIEQMRAELHASRWCQKDFEYDLKQMEKSDEPFFWMVCDNCTSFLSVGVCSIVQLLNRKAARFTLFRDFYYPVVCSFEFFATNPMVKYFYWDGYTLQRVTSYQDLCEIWSVLVSPLYNDAVNKYSEEYECRNKKLEVKFASESTQKDYEAALEFAVSLGDDSLKNCVEHMANYPRCSLDNYIEIGYDFAKHSFGFSIMADDKCAMNGGIIYFPEKQENRWQIHT